MRIALSYFYQIRFFQPYMIPLSTALWDPKWYHLNKNKYYKYIDKNGVINGLRYEPLNPHTEIPDGHKYCTECTDEDHKLNAKNHNCDFLIDYYNKLCTLDYDKIIEDFIVIGESIKSQLGFDKDPIIVLIVHEAPDNACSERWSLMKYFQEHNYPLHELNYPIVKNYRR